MEIFWLQTKDFAGLLDLEGEALARRVEECITEALAVCWPAGRERPPEALLGLERERLHCLIREWLLEVEAGRSPFVVMAEEKRSSARFGGVAIATRVDRVDRLPDGRLLVLDYKSGLVDAADLVAERLLEPQLPVYALGLDGEPAAVAFALLRRGKCAFAGVAAEGGCLPNVPAVGEWKKSAEAGVTEWGALLERWRRQLDALGRDFAAGEAVVSPADPKKACSRCDLPPLCRIAEAVGYPVSGEDA